MSYEAVTCLHTVYLRRSDISRLVCTQVCKVTSCLKALTPRRAVSRTILQFVADSPRRLYGIQSQWQLPFLYLKFPHWNLSELVFSPISVTCSAHHVLLDSIILMISEEYSYHYAVFSALVYFFVCGPNVIRCSLFPNSPNESCPQVLAAGV